MRATELAPYTSFMAMREQRMQAVSELVDSRFDWAHAFHELGRVLPASRPRSPRSPARSARPPRRPRLPRAARAGASTAATSAAVDLRDARRAASRPSRSAAAPPASRAVAQTLERLRLIDGVSERDAAELDQGVRRRRSGSGGGGAPAATRVFAVQVTFDPLPAVSRRAPTPGSTSDRRDARRRATTIERRRAMTGRDRIVLIGVVDARRARRRLDARRLARARTGRQARQQSERRADPALRAPKASWPARARRSRSTRPRTPRSSASAKPCRRARKCRR